MQSAINPLIIEAQIESLSSRDTFVVCCFYTASYHEHAMRLKASLDEFGLNYYLAQVADAGFWEANTRIKPYFIAKCLEKFADYGVLYLDADAVVKKPLDYFNHVREDVALYDTRGLANMSHDYLASTMFFNNTPASHKLVAQWIAEQHDGKRTQVDQDSLDAAMHKMANHISVAPLSAGYIKIFDRDTRQDGYDGEIYIEQYQASRSQTKLRRTLIRRRNRIIGLGAVLSAAAGLIWLMR